MHKRVAITGASGLVGTALVAALRARGDDVLPLVRRAPGRGEVRWDPATSTLDPADLVGLDAFVHLAGESIASGRWTAARKAAIRSSRVDGTATVAAAIAACPSPPRVLVCASAVGFYGHRPDPVDESAPPGRGFLPEVAVAWEAAAAPAHAAGVRVVHLRLGTVLSRHGGALPKMLPAWRLGLGGPLGAGNQPFPWVHLDDLVQMFLHAIDTPSWSGPINAVAPDCPTSRTFARALGAAVSRPAFLPVPGPLLRLVFGELAQAVLLEGAHVEPQRLRDLGFTWRHGQLEPALRFELTQPG